MTKPLKRDERHEGMPEPYKGEPVEDVISAALRLLGRYKSLGLYEDLVAHESVVSRLRSARDRVIHSS